MGYKLKKVYICDHCSKVSLPDIEYSLISPGAGAGANKVMPKGWTKLGKEHLCPECSRVYKSFKDALGIRIYFNGKEYRF